MTDQTNEPVTCPSCNKLMTPCQIENPNRIWDSEIGWQGVPSIEAWYCDNCKLVIEDPYIPY